MVTEPTTNRTTGRLGVGCPMWAHRRWIGRWFPTSTRPGHELAAYASWCTAVEGNTSFYAVPSASSVAVWAELVPLEFRFVFKLPRSVTHQRRLRHCDDEVAELCRAIEPLGSRLGPVTVQLPPTFAPDDLSVLVSFLDRLPRAFRWAVEPRHPGFFVGGRHEAALDEVLRTREIDRVILDSRALFAGPGDTPEAREAKRRKPRLPVRPVATGADPVVRFIGQTDPAANPTYWAPWVAKVASWLRAGLSPTFFVHTPDNEWSPVLARAFHTEVAAVVADLAPLPLPVVGDAEQQPRLF